MSGKTKLYQRTGSPLIQGNSRRDTSTWSVWLRGVAIGLGISWIVGLLFLLYIDPLPGSTVRESLVPAGVGVIVYGLPGLLIGSWLGTVVARGMGWRRPALAAGVVAAVIVLISAYVALYVLGWSVIGS